LHRDIKQQTILIYARKDDPDRQYAKLTEPINPLTRIVGTKYFMSPEFKYKHTFKETMASDIFALGATFIYLVLNGRDLKKLDFAKVSLRQ